MISIKINTFEFLVKPGISILEACKYVGITVPRFCYHEILSVAGNCRMCLVELENMEKPIASCVTLVENNMSIFVNTPFVKKARENVIEALLLNHPLDCPICDQAGECDLQDQTKMFGGNFSRFFFKKRGVEDKNCGPLIKTIMTRCIHCTRCVRFSSEIAGIDFLITLNRGTNTEIGGYQSKIFFSELSGNVIDLCPVGALTSKPYAFRARPWELRLSETVDSTDGLGSNLYINFKESEIGRILPKNNSFLNENLISDKARFSFDAIKNNRIQNLFKRKIKVQDLNSNSIIKWSSSDNWDNILKEIDIQLKKKSSLIIFINDELCLNSMQFLKNISRKYLNKIQLKVINNFEFKNNFYIQGISDKVINISKNKGTCFLLSSNPKIESSVLNARLRYKYQNNLSNIYSFNKTFSSNFPIHFINLNIKYLLTLFEGKNFYSSFFLSYNQSLLIIGESLKKSFSNLQLIISYLKLKFSNIKIIKINLSSNTESLFFLNINNLNRKDLLKLKNTKNYNSLFINLDDTLKLRKFFTVCTLSSSFWLNTHGSKFAINSTFILPTLTSFEQEEIYLNLEQRPQKTQKIFNNFFNARSIKNILQSLLNLKNDEFKKTGYYMNYLFEIINSSEIFETLNLQILSLNSLNIFFNNNFTQISILPTKSSLEDFYCSNNLSKNSLIMLNCSQLKRNQSTNFIT